MFRLTLCIPSTHLEAVKSAIFAAGAGRLGNYDCCAWQTLGTGQFRPLSGANPFIGKTDTVEKIEEWLVETLVTDAHIDAVIRAMRASHPYEEPGYFLTRLENPSSQ